MRYSLLQVRWLGHSLVDVRRMEDQGCEESRMVVKFGPGRLQYQVLDWIEAGRLSLGGGLAWAGLSGWLSGLGASWDPHQHHDWADH
jgi:hypothetical protein